MKKNRAEFMRQLDEANHDLIVCKKYLIGSTKFALLVKEHPDTGERLGYKRTATGGVAEIRGQR